MTEPKMKLTPQGAMVMIKNIVESVPKEAGMNCMVFCGADESKRGVGLVSLSQHNIEHTVSGIMAIIDSIKAVDPRMYTLLMLLLGDQADKVRRNLGITPFESFEDDI